METGQDKLYNRIKLGLDIGGTVMDLALVSIAAFTPVGVILRDMSLRTGSPYGDFLIFCLVLSCCLAVPGLPLDFYDSYIVEHRFSLSRQTIPMWIIERLKGLGLNLLIGIPLALGFYFFLRTAGAAWWIYFSGVVFLLSVLLAQVAPVLIFPIFYKFTPLQDHAVTEPLESLLAREGITFSGIFSFNLSRDTRKANAGFAGFGRTRRIILSDTLLTEFTPAEITCVFAHELGHMRLKHITKGIALSGLVIFTTFGICGALYDMTRIHYGYTALHDLAALPILLLYMSLSGIILMPLLNTLSRHHERQADSYAVEKTGDGNSYASALEKLAVINLADREPHPFVEFFFHGHPSIGKRIRAARAFTSAGRCNTPVPAHAGGEGSPGAGHDA